MAELKAAGSLHSKMVGPLLVLHLVSSDGAHSCPSFSSPCQEYPVTHADDFPVHLGNCQSGSSLDFDEEAMRWRNLLW